MEKALQDCCRSMRIGKILVDSDSDTHEAHVVFAKFPDDIANRKVRQFSRVKIHIAQREMVTKWKSKITFAMKGWGSNA